jgi:hypothetical protein
MAKSESVERAIVSIKAYLDEKGWMFNFNDKTCTFEAPQQREHFKESLYFRIVEDREEFLSYIIPELAIPKEFHREVVEYVTRINCGTRIGNFEFDYRDGKVLFKSSVSFKGDRLSPALVRAAVDPALIAWQNYLPGVIEVVAGVSPERAITKIDYGI